MALCWKHTPTISETLCANRWRTKLEALQAYYELLALAKDKDIRLAEYARNMIAQETAHQDEVNKLLRKSGQTDAFSATGR